MDQPRTISTLLVDFSNTLKQDNTSFKTIVEAFHERGFGVLLLVFALPMALPLPVPPGINIALASPLLLLTAQQVLGRQTIWLPAWLKNKRIKSDTLSGILTSASKFLKKLETLTKPRLSFATQGIAQNIIGLLGFIMALSVCVPLPLTNTVPSFGIAIMALGVLTRDGLAVIAGALVGMAWVVLLWGAIILFGMEGIQIVKDTIKSLL